MKTLPNALNWMSSTFINAYRKPSVHVSIGLYSNFTVGLESLKTRFNYVENCDGNSDCNLHKNCRWFFRLRSGKKRLKSTNAVRFCRFFWWFSLLILMIAIAMSYMFDYTQWYQRDFCDKTKIKTKTSRARPRPRLWDFARAWPRPRPKFQDQDLDFRIQVKTKTKT